MPLSYKAIIESEVNKLEKRLNKKSLTESEKLRIVTVIEGLISDYNNYTKEYTLPDNQIFLSINPYSQLGEMFKYLKDMMDNEQGSKRN